MAPEKADLTSLTAELFINGKSKARKHVDVSDFTHGVSGR